MLASDIIDRARIVLQDADATRWPDAELFKWINDGQRLIVLVRPDSSSTNSTVTLVAGSRQTLPGDGIRLLDVVRNIKSDNSAGRSVRMVDRERLDSQDFNWHSATATGSVINFIYDNRDPLRYYVYPQATAGMKLEILYTKNPTDVATGASTLALPDIYFEPLLNYVLYRAYGKDAEHGMNQTMSRDYLSLFMSMLGVKTTKDFAFSPEVNKAGQTPNTMAASAGGV